MHLTYIFSYFHNASFSCHTESDLCSYDEARSKRENLPCLHRVLCKEGKNIQHVIVCWLVA